MKTIRTGLIITVLLLLCILCISCAEKSGKPDVTTEETSADVTVPEATTDETTVVTAVETTVETTVDTTEETAVDTEAEETKELIMFDKLSDLGKFTTPFWRTDTMYNEATVMMVRDDGKITAKLLFKPVKIISVLSNDLKTEYTEGKDYTWDGESRTLVWLDGSAIKYFTQNDIHGKDADGKYITQWGDTANGWSDANPWDSLGRSRFGDALYCVSAFVYEKQIAVTYQYEYGSWDGPVTEYQGELLPRTVESIKNNETTNVVFYGDSIFTGCDSSSMYNREPQQKSFPTFTRLVLEEMYGKRIKLYNPSVGGKDSVWGVENTSLVTEREPDLVVIGFGMNDGGLTATQSSENIKKIIDNIRAVCPDCEFIVVAPMVPNKDGGFLVNHAGLPKTYKRLAGEGVAFVDMFSFHQKLLGSKDFISMSGNNINHPDDWLIRVYAMNILSALVDY